MGTTKLRRGVAVAAVAVGALAITAVAYAELTQTAVKNNPFVGETSGSQDDTYLAFTRNSTAHPKDFALYLQARTGGPVTRVNPEQTRGFPGGIDGNTLIYQQVTRGQSDIKVYDIGTKLRSNPPAGFNTSEWEMSPTITPDWIFFIRSGHNADKAILYDRHLATFQQIDSVNWNRSGTAYMFGAQVNGSYATWTRCTSATVCRVKVRNLTTSTTTTVPTPTGKMDYASSVGNDGTIYLIRSGHACGEGVRLRAVSPGGVDTLLVQFSPGVDITETSAHSTGTADEVLYGRYHCKTGSAKADLYQVTNPI
jgi:hypothetical protein